MSDQENTAPETQEPYAVSVRFPPELRDRIRFAAHVRDCSINSFVTTAVTTFLVGVECSAEYRQLIEILRATMPAEETTDAAH